MSRAEHAGIHAIVGSHGGVATGRHAVSVGLASLICHDAGIGFECAGVEALDFVQTYGIAAAGVDYRSARIGDPEDMLARGVISTCNGVARDAGVREGVTVAEAQRRLEVLSPPSYPLPDGGKPAFRIAEIDTGKSMRLRLLDSVSSISEQDAGAIVVTGSHCGLPEAELNRAIKARAAFVIFNDAGVGRDDAGISRLAPLAARGIAAACVDAGTARIGDATSTYERGVLSHVNAAARSRKIVPGQSVMAAIGMVLCQHT